MKLKTTYSLMDELLASKDQPLSEEKIKHQLSMMQNGMNALEKSPNPTERDWEVVSDAVNMLETMVELGACEDGSGLLQDAIEAMALAGQRHTQHGVIRLDAKGIVTLRAVLEDYAMVIQAMSARSMIHCHRVTEKKMHDIIKGKARPQDVVVKKTRKN
jgi:uncharacterized protein YyaL (SSP411 family)